MRSRHSCPLAGRGAIIRLMKQLRGPLSRNVRASVVRIGRGAALAERLERRTLLSAGDLDPTFARDGMLSVSDTSFHRYATDVALQPDGKVLTVGSRLPGASTTFAEVGRD